MPRKRVRFASVAWQVGDIQTIRPDFTDEEAANYLLGHSKYIQEAMVSAGWGVIEQFLPPKQDEEDE